MHLTFSIDTVKLFPSIPNYTSSVNYECCFPYSHQNSLLSSELWVLHYSFSFHLLYFEERWASFQKIEPLCFLSCKLSSYHMSIFLLGCWFFPVIWFQFVAVTISVYCILSSIKPNSFFRLKPFYWNLDSVKVGEEKQCWLFLFHVDYFFSF